MKMRGPSKWTRCLVGTIGFVAMLALIGSPAEARFKIRISSSKSRSTSTASKSRAASPKSDAPKGHDATETPSKVSVPTATGAPASRGYFGRLWGWLFGRKPQPVPAAAPAPTAVVPAVSPRPAAMPVPLGGQPAPLGQEKEREKGWPAGLDEGLPKVPTAVVSTQPRPVAQPSGYIIHLRNGRSISVADYEEKGDEVVIPMSRGTYGFHKSQISRIESQGVEPEGLGPDGRRR